MTRRPPPEDPLRWKVLGVVLLACFLGWLLSLAVPAGAHAITVVDGDGRVAEPYHTWANTMAVPSPPGVVRVHAAATTPCSGGAPACATADDIWIRTDAPDGEDLRNRWLFRHEVGHIFDKRHLPGTGARRKFLLLTKRLPGQDWFSWDLPHDDRPIERFATTYMLCAEGSVNAAAHSPSVSGRVYNATCPMIRRVTMRLRAGG